MPRHQADSTSRPGAGKQDADDADGQFALVAREARRDDRDEDRRRHHAERDQHGDHQREQRANGTRDAVSFLTIAARQQSGVDRDERAGERAFAEQILKNVWDSKGRVERVGRIGLQTEVVGEGAKADEAGERG